jgi:hypothetical protein
MSCAVTLRASWEERCRKPWMTGLVQAGVTKVNAFLLIGSELVPSKTGTARRCPLQLLDEKGKPRATHRLAVP